MLQTGVFGSKLRAHRAGPPATKASVKLPTDLVLKRTVEFCALAYLNQWLLHDQPAVRAIGASHDERARRALVKATAFYRVSRNLAKAHDEGRAVPRLLPLWEELRAVSGPTTQQSAVAQVVEFSAAVERRYPGKQHLSLASKVLWLRVGSPILIYDSRARRALGTKNGDLVAFQTHWHEQFAVYRSAIASACAELPRVRRYCAVPEAFDDEILLTALRATWFHERVFDLMLWHEG